MLEWIGDKLAFLSNLPWSRAWIGLALGTAGSLIAWYTSELPWALVMLGFSLFVGVWAFVASLSGEYESIVAGVIALLIGIGANAVHQQFVRQKCTLVDRNSLEVCAELQNPERKPNG